MGGEGPRHKWVSTEANPLLFPYSGNRQERTGNSFLVARRAPSRDRRPPADATRTQLRRAWPEICRGVPPDGGTVDHAQRRDLAQETVFAAAFTRVIVAACGIVRHNRYKTVFLTGFGRAVDPHLGAR